MNEYKWKKHLAKVFVISFTRRAFMNYVREHGIESEEYVCITRLEDTLGLSYGDRIEYAHDYHLMASGDFKRIKTSLESRLKK